MDGWMDGRDGVLSMGFFFCFADDNDYGLFWLMRLTGFVGWLVLCYFCVITWFVCFVSLLGYAYNMTI